MFVEKARRRPLRLGWRAQAEERPKGRGSSKAGKITQVEGSHQGMKKIGTQVRVKLTANQCLVS